MGLLGGAGPLAAGPRAAALWALVGLRPVVAMLVLAPWSERLCLKADSVWGEEALPCLSCLFVISEPAGCAHLYYIYVNVNIYVNTTTIKHEHADNANADVDTGIILP